MPDVFELYNNISEAADRALSKTAALLKQAQTIQNIKPIASTLFHGALGPGMMLYDPMDKFIKGEATFRKVSVDFVKDAKQFEVGGKIAARGIEEAGKKWLTGSQRISQGVQWTTKNLREFTNTSLMMEQTIKSLAGKTGIMARSFTGLAHAIKFSTGPIATAILATSTAYSMFVRKWMEDSDKLEAKIRSTSSLFKASPSFGGMAREATGYVGTGGTRQQFLGMMGDAAKWGTINQEMAAQSIGVARIIARQTGESINAAVRKQLEHVAVLSATGGDVAGQVRLQRMLLGGPTAGYGVRGLGERYQTWKEDTGYHLNVLANQFPDPRRRFDLLYPSNFLGRARDYARSGLDALGSVPGHITGASMLGQGAQAISSLLAGGVSWGREQQGRLGRWAWSKTGGLRGDVGQLLSVQDMIAGRMGGMENVLPYAQRRLGKQEQELEKRLQLQQAIEMYRKAPALVQGQVKSLAEAFGEIEKLSPESDSAKIKTIREKVEKITKDAGPKFQEIANVMEIIGNYGSDFADALAKGGAYATDTKALQQKVEEQRKKQDETLKLITTMKGLTGAPSPAITMKGIASMPYEALEKEVRAHEETLVSGRKRLRQLEAMGSAITPEEKRELKTLRAKVQGAEIEETGVLPEDKKAKYEEIKKNQGEEAAQVYFLQHAESTQKKMRAEMMVFEQNWMLENRKRQEAMMRSNLGAYAPEYQKRGILTTGDISTVNEELKKGALGLARARLLIEEKEAQYNREIGLAKVASERAMLTEAGGIQIESARRKGIFVGKDLPGAMGGTDDQRTLAMRVLAVREEMYQREIQFTIHYAQANAQIIQAHYDNMNALAKGKLEELDKKYVYHQRYGQEVAGAYQTMVGAQTGRYAGEDYQREQSRAQIDMMVSFAGGQLPRGLLMARQMADFKRAQRRQTEADLLGISSHQQTIGAIASTGVDMSQFLKSEGGRNLQLQLLQQNQTAYSRRGMDVSGYITSLAQQQQTFAGRRLGMELKARQNLGTSIEGQVSTWEKEVGQLQGEQQDRARVNLAEVYQKAATHYLEAGQADKAKAYMDKQEQVLKLIPDILKKDFGDAQKQSLNELRHHTELLGAISYKLSPKSAAPSSGVPDKIPLGEGPEEAPERTRGVHKPGGERAKKKFFKEQKEGAPGYFDRIYRWLTEPGAVKKYSATSGQTAIDIPRAPGVSAPIQGRPWGGSTPQILTPEETSKKKVYEKGERPGVLGAADMAGAAMKLYEEKNKTPSANFMWPQDITGWNRGKISEINAKDYNKPLVTEDETRGLNRKQVKALYEKKEHEEKMRDPAKTDPTFYPRLAEVNESINASRIEELEEARGYRNASVELFERDMGEGGWQENIKKGQKDLTGHGKGRWYTKGTQSHFFSQEEMETLYGPTPEDPSTGVTPSVSPQQGSKSSGDKMGDAADKFLKGSSMFHEAMQKGIQVKVDSAGKGQASSGGAGKY